MPLPRLIQFHWTVSFLHIPSISFQEGLRRGGFNLFFLFTGFHLRSYRESRASCCCVFLLWARPRRGGWSRGRLTAATPPSTPAPAFPSRLLERPAASFIVTPRANWRGATRRRSTPPQSHPLPLRSALIFSIFFVAFRAALFFSLKVFVRHRPWRGETFLPSFYRVYWPPISVASARILFYYEIDRACSSAVCFRCQFRTGAWWMCPFEQVLIVTLEDIVITGF